MEVAPKLKKIYIRHLPWNMGKSEIKALFEPFGSVHAIKIITDRETGRPTGNCFVEMENAEQAMQAFHGKMFENKTIEINPARERSRND
jgi:RNA recognition motif-containing protein